MKRIGKLLTVTLGAMLICTGVQAQQSCTVYAPDGRTQVISSEDVQAWKNVGWYECPVTIVYAPDGRTEVIATSDVAAWQNVGWFTTVTMYALDGRTVTVNYPDVQAWRNVGWYDCPVTAVYAPDGRTEVIASSDVAAWVNVGWYTEPVYTLSAMDGRTITVKSSEVEAYEKVGWFFRPSQDVIDRFCKKSRYFDGKNETWWDNYSQRCHMSIDYVNGEFNVEINWSSSAAMNSTWSYIGAYDPVQDCMILHNGKFYDTLYQEVGEPLYNYYFTEGTGRLYFSGDTLYWVDDVENSGSECRFRLAE